MQHASNTLLEARSIMFHSTALIALVAFTALSTVACASEAENEDEAAVESGESNVTAGNHAEAVESCTTQHEETAANAASTMAMIVAQADYRECLARANDRAVAKLETNLAEVDSHLRGQAAIAIAEARDKGEIFCAELDRASMSFGGSLSRVEAVWCRANREKAIASFMDAYAYFGVEPQRVPEHRDHHPDCYAAFDAASATAMATTEMMQAGFALAECIGKNAGGLAAPIAEVQVENDAAAGPLAAATARVQQTITDTLGFGANLCAVFNEAGENGGGSLARVTTASCQARWAANIHEDLFNRLGGGDL